jgi:hypothetical protein
MNLRLTKILSILAVALVLGWVGAISAQAEIIDFAGGSGGTLSYATTGGDLVGSGIPISSAQGTNVPLNNLVSLNSPDAVLSFTTGALTGTPAGSWSFGAGGAASITITGDLYNGPDIPANLVASGTLMSGTVTDATVTSTPEGLQFTISDFTDTKNADLLAFYGASGHWYGFLAMTSTGAASSPGTFSVTPFSTDVANVPLPPSVLLLGSGLVCLLALGQRNRKR